MIISFFIGASPPAPLAEERGVDTPAVLLLSIVDVLFI
jgi:hypothetical protein